MLKTAFDYLSYFGGLVSGFTFIVIIISSILEIRKEEKEIEEKARHEWLMRRYF